MAETYLYIKAANGKLARVPASREAEWRASQERVKTNSLTPEDKAKMDRLRKDMLEDYKRRRKEQGL